MGDYGYYKDRCILTFNNAQIHPVNNPNGPVISASKFVVKQRSGLIALIPLDDAGIQGFQKNAQNKDFSMRTVLYAGSYIIRASTNPQGPYESGAPFVHAIGAKIEFQFQNSNIKPLEARWLVINTEMVQGYHPE